MTKPRLIRRYGTWCVHGGPSEQFDQALRWSAAQWLKEQA
jgi:hypothetical protein